MRKNSIWIALLAALLHLGPVSGKVIGNDACQALVDKGHALLAQGKFREAWDTFQLARKEDPEASMPVAAMANLLYELARGTPADKAPELQRQAEAAAREALKLDERDPLAQETLRALMDDLPAPLHVPTAEASAAFNEGEALFHQKRYPEAIAKYELAAKLDPLYSTAWVMAGDGYYAQRQWHEAELRFRKATEIEARNSQAWRFLSDALLMQGERRRAEAALYNGIAAHPSQVPNWDKLEMLLRAEGMDLKRLELGHRANVKRDPATGHVNITLNYGDEKETTDHLVWLALALAESAEQKDADDKPLSPFRRQLVAWQLAMETAAKARANGKGDLTDPGLLAMEKLVKAGQLEPAVLLLMYREAYRTEFEDWKRAHPDGIKAFIAAYGLRP
ncbi:tetratricopeptide repeat protein [Massilia horti]|uniref:Tetratricopeptide repeat protein n=1 Tax=Massilia horti TaxID=2562153 RepID=A0A4Y9SN65_9BURK|nr:tetratricopeptide repeat protein [Massilia horti]TFW27891.1 tetratricopeptide repeat protein [Massilia horti]